MGGILDHWSSVAMVALLASSLPATMATPLEDHSPRVLADNDNDPRGVKHRGIIASSRLPEDYDLGSRITESLHPERKRVGLRIPFHLHVHKSGGTQFCHIACSNSTCTAARRGH